LFIQTGEVTISSLSISGTLVGGNAQTNSVSVSLVGSCTTSSSTLEISNSANSDESGIFSSTVWYFLVTDTISMECIISSTFSSSTLPDITISMEGRVILSTVFSILDTFITSGMECITSITGSSALGGSSGVSTSGWGSTFGEGSGFIGTSFQISDVISSTGLAPEL